MLPDSDDLPAERGQVAIDASVASAISGYFLFPIGLARPRRSKMARTSMPKAPVDEDGHPKLRENEIRFACERVLPSPAHDLILPKNRQKSHFRRQISGTLNRPHYS